MRLAVVALLLCGALAGCASEGAETDPYAACGWERPAADGVEEIPCEGNVAVVPGEADVAGVCIRQWNGHGVTLEARLIDAEAVVLAVSGPPLIAVVEQEERAIIYEFVDGEGSFEVGGEATVKVGYLYRDDGAPFDTDWYFAHGSVTPIFHHDGRHFSLAAHGGASGEGGSTVGGDWSSHWSFQDEHFIFEGVAIEWPAFGVTPCL